MPKRTDLSHAEAVRVHAIRRLVQRTGIAINDAEYAALTELVRGRLTRPSRFTESGRPLWLVVVQGRAVYAAWHTDVKSIGTFTLGGSLLPASR